MKRKKGILVLLCAFFLAACGAKSIVDTDTAAKLSSDVYTMDFSLDGVIYTLPDATLSDFIDNGWNVDMEGFESIQLKPGYYVEIKLSKENTTMTLHVANDEEQALTLPQTHVMMANISYLQDEEPLVLVVKGGITLQSSPKDAQNIIIELNKSIAITEEENSFYNTEIYSEDGFNSILGFYENDGVIRSITIGDEYATTDTHLEYESSEDEIASIASKKEKLESESKENVEGHYSELVKDDNISTGVHMKFTIIEEGEKTSNFSGVDISTGRAYLVSGEDGNLYALNVENVDDKAYIVWTDLAEGDEVEVWGTIHELLSTDDVNVMLPNITASIIEKNGTMIYRGY